MPADKGAGLIWRVFSATRLKERDGGVFLEVEAIVLSRDIPATLRWLIEPLAPDPRSLYPCSKPATRCGRPSSWGAHVDAGEEWSGRVGETPNTFEVLADCKYFGWRGTPAVKHPGVALRDAALQPGKVVPHFCSRVAIAAAFRSEACRLSTAT